MKTSTTLRVLRTATETAAAALLTLWLSGLAAAWIDPVGEWLASVQFLPAAMAFALGVFVLWLIVTLVFGRIYCSTLCPMGAWQDAVARLRPRGSVYRWMRPMNGLRFGVAAAVVACLLLSFALPALILDPYTAWQRTVGGIARVAAPSMAGFLAAAAICAAAALAAWRSGRLWCNTFCPVGAMLGLVSRHSVFRIDIDTDRCTNCRRCEYACKARCINLDDHVADMSRCVVCFDCLTSCRDDAIHYTASRKRLSTPLMQRLPSLRLRQPGSAAPTALDSETLDPASKDLNE